MKTITFLLVSLTFFFEGCMMGMVGGFEHGNEDNNSQINSVTKEVIVSNYILIAEFPAPMLHRRDHCKLKIVDLETNQNSGTADVWFITSDNSTGGKFVETRLDQNSANGYSASYILESEDEKIIGFRVSSINGEHLQKPAEILHDMQAKLDHGDHSGMGMMDYAPYMIGGVVMMAGMMFLFMTR